MVKTVIICLLNRILFFATFEKVRSGSEQKLRNIYIFLNPSGNY